MCPCMNQALAAKQTWKGRDGKTKRGRPAGPREVVEKYRALGMHAFEMRNHKQAKVADRVVGSGFSCSWCESVAERTRLRIKRELKSRPLADAAELPLDIIEQEARQELVQLVEDERQALENDPWKEAAEQGCPFCQELAAQAEGSCQ